MDRGSFDQLTKHLARRLPRRTWVVSTAGLALFGGDIASALGQGAAGEGGRCRREGKNAARRAIRRASRRHNQRKKSMLCVATCESNLDNCAVNRSGPYYGLFQFLPSTFKSTPYGNKDIFDPKWNAMAAAWMWKQGRQNEWACCDRRYGCKCKG